MGGEHAGWETLRLVLVEVPTKIIAVVVSVPVYLVMQHDLALESGLLLVFLIPLPKVCP